MKIIKFITIGLLITGVTTFSSCKKEIEKQISEHETNQPHSSVNSSEITVYQNEWYGDGDGYEATKSAPIITSEIASKGAVLCYLKEGNEYLPMPITMSAGQGMWIFHLLFSYQTGSITFVSYDDDGLSNNPGTLTFKVVTIEHTGMILNPDVDWTDYETVKETFNLAD